MDAIQISRDINLCTENWGNVPPQYISSVLKCTIEYFDKILINPKNASLIITHWEADYPQCCKSNDNTHMIYLTSKEYYDTVHIIV